MNNNNKCNKPYVENTYTYCPKVFGMIFFVKYLFLQNSIPNNNSNVNINWFTLQYWNIERRYGFSSNWFSIVLFRFMFQWWIYINRKCQQWNRRVGLMWIEIQVTKTSKRRATRTLRLSAVWWKYPIHCSEILFENWLQSGCKNLCTS